MILRSFVAHCSQEKGKEIFFAIGRMSVKKLRIEAAILRIDLVGGGIG